ncbi:MAG: alpha/beta hydrolase [Lachnospiraceae bacterium]
MKRLVCLEQAATKVCEANSTPPLIFQLPPAEGRKKLNEAQNSPVCKAPAVIDTLSVSTGIWGIILVHIVRPTNLVGTPNVMFYTHGAGWVFGNLHTHDKLVRELAARTNSILVFPEYSLSPEARYPTAIEQCYSVLMQTPMILRQLNLIANLNTLTVAGDSVGGNMATVMTLMAKFRGGPYIHKQVMFYPVTNACFNTCSYQKFADNYYLYRAGMMWFWNQYAPDTSVRFQITASPLQASTEQLRGLPDALIINGEADVLRDEGENYARKLRCADVDVTTARFNGIIHDFVMLNALDQTNACRGAMDLATEWINQRNC